MFPATHENSRWCRLAGDADWGRSSSKDSTRTSRTVQYKYSGVAGVDAPPAHIGSLAQPAKLAAARAKALQGMAALGQRRPPLPLASLFLRRQLPAGDKGLRAAVSGPTSTTKQTNT